jgi:hypothetical protein
VKKIIAGILSTVVIIGLMAPTGGYPSNPSFLSVLINAAAGFGGTEAGALTVSRKVVGQAAVFSNGTLVVSGSDQLAHVNQNIAVTQIMLHGFSAEEVFVNGAAALDQKLWSNFANNDGTFHYRLESDNFLSAPDWMLVTRTAATSAVVSFPATTSLTVAGTASFTGAGTVNFTGPIAASNVPAANAPGGWTVSGGCTTAPSVGVKFSRAGNLLQVDIPVVSCTISGTPTSVTLTGTWPSFITGCTATSVQIVPIQNAGSGAIGLARVNPNTNILVSVLTVASPSGTFGIGGVSQAGDVIVSVPCN